MTRERKPRASAGGYKLPPGKRGMGWAAAYSLGREPEGRMKRTLTTVFVVVTVALAMAIPVYVAFRDDRRVRSAYIGWRSGDYTYEASARFLGWRFSVRIDVPRRDRISDSNISLHRYDPRYNTLSGPGSYWPNRFGVGFDSYPLQSSGVELGEKPQWLGFGGGSAAPLGTTHRVYTVWLPVWFMVGVLALPGAQTIARITRARRRRGSGRCTACGYDLRGGHERCPECGADAITRPLSAPDRPAAAPRPASRPA